MNAYNDDDFYVSMVMCIQIYIYIYTHKIIIRCRCCLSSFESNRLPKNGPPSTCVSVNLLNTHIDFVVYTCPNWSVRFSTVLSFE